MESIKITFYSGLLVMMGGALSASHAVTARAEVPAESVDLLKQRQQLLSQFRKRNLELRDLIQVEETRGRITVNIFVNKFFLPNSTTLQADGLSVLNQLAGQLRKRQGKEVVLNTIFKASAEEPDPGNRSLGSVSRRVEGARLVELEESIPEALIAQRCMIIFSYLISGALRNPQ